MRSFWWAGAAGLTVALLVGAAGPVAAAPHPAIPSDFNGDGYADIAVGAPFDRVGASGRGAGSVTVIYGSAKGLRAKGAQRWTQATPGVKGSPVGRRNRGTGPEDWFGIAVASCDFDRDGYADLAIGVPGERLPGTTRAVGAVNVLYGSPAGLTAKGDQLWTQAKLPGRAERNDQFGMALAAGDANGDGYGDLVVGIPGDDVGQLGNEGSAQVIYGSRDGLAAKGSRVLIREMTGAPDEKAGFGVALALGDLDGDGRDDLAVGAPDANHRAGDVSVFYATSGRLAGAGSEQWDQDSPGVDDSAESYDEFGTSVEIGDFDGDGFGDLAVGVPWESVLACGTDAGCRNGAVEVLRGAPEGLTAEGSSFWHFGLEGVPGEVAPDDWFQEGFGMALAAGDLGEDGIDDLAIGVPWDTVGDRVAVGSVLILEGSVSGLTADGATFWSQDDPRIPGGSEGIDLFGYALAIGNLGRAAIADLVIGVPSKHVDFRNAGALVVLYGTTDGVATDGAQAWSLSTPGIPGATRKSAYFGRALVP